MGLFIILGVVVLLTFIVLGALFFGVIKEGEKEEEKPVPLRDLEQPKNGSSSEILPSFENKVFPPSQAAQVPSDEEKPLIEALIKENEPLKNQQADLEQAQQKLAELQDLASNLRAENVSLQTQLESINAKMRLLEEEASRANATASELNREKEALLSAPKSGPDEALRHEEEVSRLKAENASLQTQLESTNATMRLLEEEISRANAMASSAPQPGPDEALHHEEEISRLKAENVSLQAQLESTNAKMHLLEEESSRANATVSSAPQPGPDEALGQELESLKYELIKAKAQSSGLERTSFNYKNQLEDSFKKVNAMQVSNDHLFQIKNQLEGMVKEIELQNEELVKKDQLAQFELEKNRSRLASLEREYEDLKARVQEKNQ